MQNNKINPIVLVLLALLSSLGIYYKLNIESSTISTGFFFSFLLASYIIIYNSLKKISKKENALSIVFSFLLSSVLIVGEQLDTFSNIDWTFFSLLKIIFLTFSIYPFMNFFNILLTNQAKKIKDKGELKNKKLYVAGLIIIFAGGLIGWLAVFPGIYGYDAGYEILLVLNKLYLSSHFSVIYTLFLGNCIKLGMSLFGSYSFGLAIYSLIQFLFLTYVSNKVAITIYYKTHLKWLYVFSICLFSLFPPYIILSLSTSQDPIFAGIYALIMLRIIDLEEKDIYSNKKFELVILMVEILFLCLLRNNGFYLLFFPIILFVIGIKKNKKNLAWLFVFLVPMVLYKIITGPIYKKMNIISSNSLSEMMSIPSQQLARAYNYNSDLLTERDIKQLDDFYYDLTDFNNYTIRQSIADPIKSIFDQEFLEKNVSSYIGLWVRIGAKSKKDYIESFLINTLSFWYPNKSYPDERMYHPYIEYEMLDAKKWNDKYIVISRDSKLKVCDNYYNFIINNNNWQRIPVLSLLFEMGSYFILYLLIVGYMIVYKSRKYIISSSMIFGLYCTLFLAPVALYRYIMPILMILPVMIYILLMQISDNNKRKGKNAV